jgi:hypothetical protein
MAVHRTILLSRLKQLRDKRRRSWTVPSQGNLFILTFFCIALCYEDTELTEMIPRQGNPTALFTKF